MKIIKSEIYFNGKVGISNNVLYEIGDVIEYRNLTMKITKKPELILNDTLYWFFYPESIEMSRRTYEAICYKKEKQMLERLNGNKNNNN